MLLLAQNIVKFYGLRPVLRGASLAVDGGEFVAMLGANGSGKSTLLRVLATLGRPEKGSLEICGVDALAHGDLARQHIGVVMHQSMLYPDLSAKENLMFHARLHGLADAPARVTRALERVNLAARADDPARMFSRGMIQRLTLARVLLQNAQVILLDEPFTGLDAASAQNLSILLMELAAGGKAIVMTTHEQRGMEGVTRVVRLEEGKLTEDGRPKTVAMPVPRLPSPVS
ncbi:MAG TPA: heme ABC exporter ATP-binding protein CcmA [Thermoflexales bacterium]|nr:heme ABC exporter ATP-binding protein CcmA [Thermoflexales bacterium]